MIKKILIANRGEIALRVIRACKELGIQTVAIYSQADEESLHVSMADEAYCIGPYQTSKSYLNVPNIISTALMSGVDAIHPGYGFMSENADFAEICEAHNIKFIGPAPESIRLMGDKATARKTMSENNVPIIKGTDIVSDIDELKAWVNNTGYPIIIKATAGGGGKGMRIVQSENELEEMFNLAKNEAGTAFGNSDVYAEKYIQNPRHVEVQIIADKFGNVCYLGERDCSIQRRHQKLVEESPSPIVSPDLRKKMGEAAVRAAKSINYEGVGTVEFLVEGNEFYFMEMNTRIQVEHTITEVVTNIDLVKEQILVASGRELSFKQDDISINGHAIECRINAENPDKDFLPCPGTIDAYVAPGGFGVRVDSHVYTKYKIPPYYDSMIGKLICWGKTREDARKRMIRALSEYIIEGVSTTIPFHQKIMSNVKFINGKFTTSFIEQEFSAKPEEIKNQM